MAQQQKFKKNILKTDELLHMATFYSRFSFTQNEQKAYIQYIFQTLR